MDLQMFTGTLLCTISNARGTQSLTIEEGDTVEFTFPTQVQSEAGYQAAQQFIDGLGSANVSISLSGGS